MANDPSKFRRVVGGVKIAPLVVLASIMTNERWQRLRAAGVTRCLLKRIDSECLNRELLLAGNKDKSGSTAPEAGRKNAQ